MERLVGGRFVSAMIDIVLDETSRTSTRFKSYIFIRAI